MGGDGIDADNDLELLGVAAADELGTGQVDAEHRVAAGRSWTWLVGIAVVFAIGIAALTTAGDDDAAPLDDAAGEAGDDPTPSTTFAPTAAESDAVDPEVAATVPPDGEPPEGRSSLLLPSTDLARLGQIFDAPTGYSLLVGGERSLRRVQLDRGEVTDWNVIGNPIVVVDGRLLFQSNSSPQLWLLDLDDPDAPRLEVGTRDDFYRPWLVDDAGIWMLPWVETAVPARRFDLATGEINGSLELSEVGVEWLPVDLTVARRAPILVNGRAGGIYRWASDGFERVADGRIVAFGVNLAIVETCDERLRCTRGWIDASTLEPIDHPSPPAADGWQVVAGADRWLVASGPPSWSSRVVEIATGREVELTSGGIPPDTLTISPDGRFAAWPSSEGIELVELETGSQATIAAADLGFNRSTWRTLLFVPNTEFGDPG